MSIYITKDGQKKKVNVSATDVQLLDIDGRFKSKNLEDALKEVGSGTETNMTRIEEEVNTLTTQLNDIKYKIELNITRLYRSIKSDLAGVGSYCQGSTRTVGNKAIYSMYDRTTPSSNIVELCEVDYVTGEELRSVSLPLGHCNSITYNKDTNELLVAVLNKYVDGVKKYVSDIIIIDYDTLAIKETKILGDSYVVSSIAYDEKNKNYVLLIDDYKIMFCDYTLTANNNLIDLKIEDNIKDYTRQSIEVFNDRLYLLTYASNCLCSFDFNGNNLQNYNIPNFIDNMFLTGEVEDISSLGNGEFLLFSANNIGTKYSVNMISKFSLVKNVVKGVPYTVSNPGAPKKIYVDINSNCVNPNGTESKKFKQLNEAILSCFNPNLNNIEIYLADGEYDWSYIGCNPGKIAIIGNDKDKVILKGLWLSNANISIKNVTAQVSENSSYVGSIGCYQSKLSISNSKIYSDIYGIRAENSDIKVMELTELNSAEKIYTLYGFNSSNIQIQKSASNIVKACIDNTSQISPHLLIYNNIGTNECLKDITIPNWFNRNIENNSIKFLDIACGIKISNNAPNFSSVRVNTAGWNSFTINMSRVSIDKTYISTINFIGDDTGNNKVIKVKSAYITTIDNSTGTPVVTTQNMGENDLGAILIGRITATN